MAGFRKKTAVISAMCLLSGLAIYSFMRSETHFHGMLPVALEKFLDGISNRVPSNLFTDFLRYYFADFLWCASLDMALCSVTPKPCRKNFTVIFFVSFAVGVIFEIAQLLSLVNGTFDFADIVMYAAASVACAAVSIKYFEE